jgi:hypothetical protein
MFLVGLKAMGEIRTLFAAEVYGHPCDIALLFTIICISATPDLCCNISTLTTSQPWQDSVVSEVASMELKVA